VGGQVSNTTGTVVHGYNWYTTVVHGFYMGFYKAVYCE